jgi:hypothetical protein
MARPEKGTREHAQFCRERRMSFIDRMSPELRACVHDYSLSVVRAFMDIGVREPRHIRHLVETVLDEFSPTRGSSSRQAQHHFTEEAEG